MKTWTLETRLDGAGRLHLDVPIADGPQDVDVVLVVSPREQERRPDWAAVENCLGKLALTDDPVQWQRRERSQWGE